MTLIAQSAGIHEKSGQLLRGASGTNPEKVNKILDELDEGVQESITDVREPLVHFRTRTNTPGGTSNRRCRRPCRS